MFDWGIEVLAVESWIEEAYHQHYSFLYIVGLHYLRGRSAQILGLEDSIQTVFMLMIKKRKKLETHPNIKGWLIVALRRELCARSGKERTGRKHLAFSLDDDKEFQKNNALMDNLHDPELFCLNACQEKIDMIEKLIGKENTDILMQYYVEGVSLSELARQKYTKETALKMRIFRLKEKIRSHSELFLLISFFTLLLPY